MRRLHKSIMNKKIAGVCAGIAETLNIDPTIIRIIALLLLIFSRIGGGVFILYLALWLILPEE